MSAGGEEPAEAARVSARARAHQTLCISRLHGRVSGFDTGQMRRSGSSVSPRRHCDHLRSSVGGGGVIYLVSASIHDRSARHSLHRRREFMDVLSHLIVTLMEAEAGKLELEGKNGVT